MGIDVILSIETDKNDNKWSKKKIIVWAYC